MPQTAAGLCVKCAAPYRHHVVSEVFFKIKLFYFWIL